MSWRVLDPVSYALRFFFGVTLGRQDAIAHIVRAKEPKKLPVVLSAEEIARFLEAVPGLRSRAALTTAYGVSCHLVNQLAASRHACHCRQVATAQSRRQQGASAPVPGRKQRRHLGGDRNPGDRARARDLQAAARCAAETGGNVIVVSLKCIRRNVDTLVLGLRHRQFGRAVPASQPELNLPARHQVQRRYRNNGWRHRGTAGMCCGRSSSAPSRRQRDEPPSSPHGGRKLP